MAKQTQIVKITYTLPRGGGHSTGKGGTNVIRKG